MGILLLSIDPPPTQIWRWCSGMALGLMIPFIVVNSKTVRKIPRQDQQNVSRLLYFSMAVLGTVTFVLQIINITAWNRFWAFFASIFVNLVAAIAQFLRLVLLPPHRKAENLE
jgi:hypothetical protein